MKTHIIIIIMLFPIYLFGQQRCNSKNCIKYGLALKKGNSEYNNTNYKDAVFQYLAAEVASRECGCNAPNIKSKIAEAIAGLEQQKKNAEWAEKRAINLKQKELRQRKKLEEERVKTERLESLVKSIDDNNSAYQFLYNEGVRSFNENQFKDALVYFANAAFLDKNDTINDMVKYAQLGVEANMDYTAGYIEEAEEKYLSLLMIDYKYSDKNIEYFSNRLNKIDKSIKVYNKKVRNNPDTLKQLDFHYEKGYHDLRQQLEILPAKIGQLNKLEFISLSNNNLEWLPAEIGQLTNLQKLDLTNNFLISLPPEIGQLKNLTTLILSSNSLINLPIEIKNLTKLEYLDLRDNEFSRISKTERKKIEDWLPNCTIEWE